MGYKQIYEDYIALNALAANKLISETERVYAVGKLRDLIAAQHRMHLTAFGVGLAAFILGYFVGAEHVIHRVFGGW